MALADGFITSSVIQKDLQTTARNMILIFLLADSPSLFDFIMRASDTAEKRILNILKTLKNISQKEIDESSLVKNCS